MPKKDRILRMSKVRPQEEKEMDSVAYSKQWDERRGFDLLMQAQHYWDNMSQFRKDRERNKRYTYGDQWKDYIEVDGNMMTEESYIAKQGNVPLKNNLIRRLVRNVLGVSRSQTKEPICTARDRDEKKYGETMSTVLQYNMQLNKMTEMYARTMEDFLIGGMVVHRKWYGWRNEKLDCWTDYINPNCFFIDNNMRDFRGWDVSMVGEVHDVDFAELCHKFAKSPGDRERLKDIYKHAHDRRFVVSYSEQFGYSQDVNYDFLYTSDHSRCRVIEIWRKESKPRYRCHDYNSGDVFKVDVEDYAELVESVNQSRIKRGLESGMQIDDIPLIEATWFIDSYWYYYQLTPFGDILEEGETPYDHKSHPYVFKAYPFIDGEIHSFVSDVVDQQRYVNRLITLYDFIMRASAKGALLFPEGSLPEGMSMEDIAEEWSRFDGIIVYKPKAGVPMPQQIHANSTNIGISELLNLQLKFFEDISGVNGALQGKPGYSGMSASLYHQQAQNSATSLVDLLDSFSSFVLDAAYKDVKNIQQFYDSKRFIEIVGKDANIKNDKIRDVDFDYSIVESTATPTYRQLANDILMQLWSAQAISVEQLLTHGDFPFADELLQSIQSQKEQVAQGQMPEGVSLELLAQAQQGANMNAVAQAQQIMK